MATEWISRDSIVAALDMCAVLEHYDIKAGCVEQAFAFTVRFTKMTGHRAQLIPSAKVFNCFSCGEQGNVLDFIAGMEDLDPKGRIPRSVGKGHRQSLATIQLSQKNARTGTKKSRSTQALQNERISNPNRW